MRSPLCVLGRYTEFASACRTCMTSLADSMVLIPLPSDKNHDNIPIASLVIKHPLSSSCFSSKQQHLNTLCHKSFLYWYSESKTLWLSQTIFIKPYMGLIEVHRSFTYLDDCFLWRYRSTFLSVSTGSGKVRDQHPGFRVRGTKIALSVFYVLNGR